MTKEFDPAHAAEHGCTIGDRDEVSDNPEWTADDIARAKPRHEALPELHAALTASRKRGPIHTKTPITIRLDDAVVSAFRATGPSWQARVNDVLKDWLAKAGQHTDGKRLMDALDFIRFRQT